MRAGLLRFFAAVTLALVAVTGAQAQTSQNMNLLSELSEHGEYADIWGYADGTGREYAILGAVTGTAIINVTDPANPYETGFFDGPFSFWRDVKTYGTYAYEVNETNGGMRIIDLSDPEAPSIAATYTGFTTAHNLYIDEANARAYVAGSNVGTAILSLANPIAPVQIGVYSIRYVHDLYVRDHIAYLAEINRSFLTIYDFTVPQAPALLGGPFTYSGALTHNTWLNEPGTHVVTTDEAVGGVMNVWDIQNLPNIVFESLYQAPVTNSIIHNAIVHGNRAYISYYTEGVHVVDLTDPGSPTMLGFYDTWDGPSGSFNGVWGVYPFLPSGIILASDIDRGLIVLELMGQLGSVSGVVTEWGVGTPIAGALVELLGSQNTTSTDFDGSYALSAPAGSYTLRVSYEGFANFESNVSVLEDENTLLNAPMQRLPSDFLRGMIETIEGPTKRPLDAVRLWLEGTSYEATTDGVGAYEFPQIPYGNYVLNAQRAGFVPRQVPVQVNDGGSFLDLILNPVDWYDDVDVDLGWSLSEAGDTATSGFWERAVPVGSGQGLVQPGIDSTPGADDGLCFVTGNAPNASDPIGTNDIDTGTTTLTSPTIDISGMADPKVAYSRWYVNAAGANPNVDFFTIEVSDNGGGSWTQLEQMNKDATPWTRVEFDLANVVNFDTTTDQFRIRFIAADASPGSIVEAAIDDLEVYGSSATSARPNPRPRLTVELLPNAPNPFNPATTFRFRLANRERVRLDIHDLRGRRVATVLDEDFEPGDHARTWQATDARGRSLASGVYLARLRAGGDVRVQKITLAK